MKAQTKRGRPVGSFSGLIRCFFSSGDKGETLLTTLTPEQVRNAARYHGRRVKITEGCAVFNPKKPVGICSVTLTNKAKIVK